MIRAYEVVKPPNQGELMQRINAVKAGGAVLELIIKAEVDELARKRGDARNDQTLTFSMSVDSIHDINGNPYLLGFESDNETRMARLEVLPVEDMPHEERPLSLIVSEE